jgi:hypothetical protein
MTSVKANIALTTVILAGAILITTGIAVLYNAMDISIATKSYLSRTTVETKLTSCIEEGMFRIVKSLSYTGNYSVTFADGTCTGTVTIDPTVPTKRHIIVTATYLGGYTLQREKLVDTTTSPYTLTNY